MTERCSESRESSLQRLVRDGEREACPALAAPAEALARGDGEAMVDEQPLCSQRVGQLEPNEERSFRLRIHSVQCGQGLVSAPLVGQPSLVDRLLRARQGCHPRLLDRSEDTGEDMVLKQLDAADELGV